MIEKAMGWIIAGILGIVNLILGAIIYPLMGRVKDLEVGFQNHQTLAAGRLATVEQQTRAQELTLQSLNTKTECIPAIKKAVENIEKTVNYLAYEKNKGGKQ